MYRFRLGITYCLAALLAVFAAGCGQETVTVPSVVSTIPTNGATNVALDTPISATFSMAMNPATITAATFTVTGPDGAAVAGTVAYSGLTATFTPAAVLQYAANYTAAITTGAESRGDTPLISNYVWRFTTITPPPAVIATVPANGATNVPIGQILSATFNEPMSPATISAATFTVTGPGRSDCRGLSYIQRSNCHICAVCESGLWRGIHGHDHYRSCEPRRHSFDFQLRVEIYDDYSAACGDCHCTCEWRNQCAHQPDT